MTTYRKSKWNPPEAVRIRGRPGGRRCRAPRQVGAAHEDTPLANRFENSASGQMRRDAESKVMFSPEYVHDPESDKRMAAQRRRDFMKSISADAAAMAGAEEGSAFEAAVLLLVMIKKKSAD